MKSNWDIKSIVVGAVIGVVGLAVLGAEAPQGASSGQVGRFQITAIQAAGYGPIAYVVDTVTGQVWNSNAKGFSELKPK